MKRFDVSLPETEIGGKHFLQASAGTGKTFTIEHLVCRLICEMGLKIEEILVVTFTRAATRELRCRIRTLLQKKNLSEAVASFDGAQIFTIHGFCQRLLQEFAFETLFPLRAEKWSVYEEEKALEKFLLKKIDGKIFSAAQVAAVLHKSRGDLEKVKKAILRKKGAPLATFEEITRNFNEKISEIASFSIREEFSQAALCYKKMDASHHDKQVAILEEILKTKQADAACIDVLFSHGPLFLQHIGGDLRKKNISPPPHHGLDALKKALLPFSEEVASADRVLQGLAHAWQLERKRIGREEGKIAPDDILDAVQECLDDPAFVAKARKNIRAVIVDEFQDTDPIQWKIFDTLFKDHELAAYYLVGDPKQSIYAFRSADVYTYMAAGKSLGEEAFGVLDTNWRSTVGLGKQLNNLFCTKPWLDLPKVGEFLNVPPVQYAKEGEGELHFMIAEESIGRKQMWPTFEMEERCFFPFIAEKLNMPLEHNVVLVKDRYQAARLKSFFKKHGIPCSVQRGGSLADSLALDLLLELIRGDVRKLLAGPFFRYPAEEITQEAVFTLKIALESLDKTLEGKGFAPFFDAFLRFSKSREYLDPELYSDLLDLVEKASGESDVTRLIHFFEELQMQEIEERASLEANGVQIMTIHASKGLEFETVFALALASRTTSSDLQEEDIPESDAEKMRQFYVACTRAKSRLFLPIARSLDNKEAKKGCGSPMEIFLQRTTVDITQFTSTILTGHEFQIPSFSLPQEEVVFSFPASINWPDRKLLSFSSLSQKSAHFVNAPENVLYPHRPETLNLDRAKTTGINDRKEVNISNIDLFTIVDSREFSRRSKSTFQVDGGIPTGAETGVILHKIFENMFTCDVESLVIQETKGTILEKWKDDIIAMVQKTLALPLINFSLSDVAPSRMLHELEFLFPKEGNMIKGFIDLCFEHSGKYYIVDWKSNYLSDYSQEGLQEAMQANDYFLQGAIYATALRKHIANMPFGGAFYVFVRGPAVYHFIPEKFV